MIMCGYLVEHMDHHAGTFNLLDELEAIVLIKKGIVKTVDGTMPELPQNFIMGPMR